MTTALLQQARMRTKQKLSTMSFSVATPRIKTSYKGLLNEGILCAFYNVSAADRPTIIAELQAAHQKLCKAEGQHHDQPQ